MKNTKKILGIVLALIVLTLVMSISVFAADTSDNNLYVNCDYNSSTEGWGVTHFSNYAGAYAYASVNNKTATIVIEKTNTLSGNTFDNNHKDCSKLAVVIKDGATMGVASSKWDMTFPVTVEPGGTLTCARPKTASVCYIHIKNTLTVGAQGSAKKAVVDFLSDSYQDCDISIRFNGKVLVYNSDFRVQDLDAQGALTIEGSDVYVDGAFASATFYATTLTNSTMTVKGNQISGGISDFAGGTSNQLGNVKITNSTLTIEEGTTKVAANVTVVGSTLDFANLTVNSGKTVKLDDASTLAAENVTLVGSAKVTQGEGSNASAYFNAKIGETAYATLEEAFAAAVEGDTIVLLADATPALTSQRAITKAAFIDLGGKILTLTEDDLYFGTTTFKNGTIVVDPSVNPSTAVFWMFADQTLTFDGVKIVATGVTGTYLIGLDGNNSDLNLLNGSEILVENTSALDLDIICVNASTGNDIVINNSKVNVTNLDGRVFFRGNYTVKGTSEIALSGITKAGFRIEANQTLSIEDTAKVTIAGEPRDGGIHITDASATYTKAETATVTATVNQPITYVATVNGVGYATLADALAAAKAMTGNVVVEILDKVTLNTGLAGSYDSIKFVGKTETAEIYLDLQGYSEATGEKVAFEDLKLSKVAGGYVANAGFMNLAFGVFNPVEVTYTNCTFLNGAYASGGTATFTGCDFYSSHDRYSFWAYGDNSNIVIDDCDFVGARGIKMYSENHVNPTIDLTVKNTDFTAADGKPAIVLTYGTSVTLENNVYPSKGVFELDLDGKPNGVSVTSKDTITCINDNGACGVLVDGKIYTTVAQAAEFAVEGSKVTLLYNSAETVELPAGVELNKNGFDAAGITVKKKGLSGTGTEADPFLITSLEDLIWFRDKVDEQAQDGSTQFAGKYFKLTADIDLAGINWNPIGTMSGDHGSFKGVFDGDNHKISNLNVQQAGDGIGLFARTAGNAVIKNLTLNNVTVKSTNNSNYVGGLVGNAYASTKIENVHVTGTIDISGRGYIGGIAGHGYVVMDNVSVDGTGTIYSTFWCAGGILGYAGEGSTNIMNAHVEGVTITSAAGGLGAIVGMAEDNDGTQPISGSNLSAKNVVVKTFVGAYGTAYADYALGVLYGGNPTSNLTGKLTAENVKVETSTGAAPTIVDAVATVNGAYYFSLQEAIASVQEGQTIVILAGTIKEGTIKLPATLKNVTIKGAEGAILKDTTISAADGNSYSYIGLTFDGITFDNSRIVLTGWRNGEETIENLTITNCTFKNINDTTNNAAVHINKDASEAVNGFTFTNNVIDGATGGSKSGVYLQATGKVVFNNNIINNVSFRPYVIQMTTDDGIADEFIVTGNTFSGSAVGRAQGLGNNASGTDTVTLVVSNNIFKDITNSQQICYWNFNPETTTVDLSKNYYDIDILANPSKIYFNSAAQNVIDLINKNVYPYYADEAKTEEVTAPAIMVTYPVGNPVYPDGKVEYFDNILEAVPYTTNCPRLEGATITLLKDVSGSGLRFMENDMVFDLNGHTFTITAGTGSQGSNTSGFQIRPEVTTSVIFKNGTIKVAEGAPVVWMFNCYATDFVVENVTVDCTNMAWNYGGSCYVVVSRVGDNVQFTGNTKIENFNAEIAGNAINVGGTMTIGENVVVGGTVELDAGATLTAPAGLTVVTAEGYKVVYENGSYKSVEVNYVAQIGDTYYETFEDAVNAIPTDGTDVVIKILTDIELTNSIDFNYGTGKITFTADAPVVIKQTKVGLDLAFTIGNAATIVVDKNVTFEIYDNASGMYVYYGPCLTINGSIVGGQNWGCLYMFYGEHLVTESGEINVGRVQYGFAVLTVNGKLTSNYLLVEAGDFVAKGATINVGAIHDSNNGGTRYGASDFSFLNGTVVTANTVTLKYADSTLKLDLSSSLTANKIVGQGKIIIDVSGFNGKSTQVITADMSGFTGEIELVNGKAAYEKTDSGLVIKTAPVAQIGDTYYATLYEAMVAAKAGETVILLADVDLAGTEWEPVSFKGAFDGQNHKISNLTINKPGVSNVGFITSLNGSFKNVTFVNPTVTGGECTGVVAGRAGGSSALAENITVTGTIKIETTHSGYARAGVIVGGWAYGNYKNITVDGVDEATSYIKHTGGGDGRYVGGIVGHADEVQSYVNCTVKNITISGGWLCGGIAGPGPAAGVASGCSVENIKMNADYSGGMFGWYFGSGTIENSTIKNVEFTKGSSKNGAIGGYSANPDATISNVTIENVVNYDGAPLLEHVAKIGDTYYLTLQEAFNAGGEVVVLKDIVLEDTVTIPAGVTVTLDLNGKTISQTKAQTGNYEMIRNDGNLTIKDSVGGGKISYTDTVGGEFVSNTITNRGTLTLKSGTIENNSSQAVANAGYPYAIDTSIWGTASEVVVNIEGGKVYCESYSAIRLRADSVTKPVYVNISGGEVYGRIEVQNPSSNAATVGKLTISGGEINKNNSSMAIMIFGGGGTAENLKVEITNGTVVGKVGYSSYFSIEGFDENVITGGIFDTDVSDFCAQGFVAVANGDGTYGIKKGLRGSGTEADPYKIYTVEDLIFFRDSVNAGETTYNKAGKYVALMADIDLANAEWAPIGTSSNPFKGVFDGQGYTISNLVITGNNSNVGLFGYTTNGEIKNLTVNNARVSGRLNVAVVAGTPYTSKFTNVKVTGHIEVNGMAYVGGVGGKNAYANWTDITVAVDATSYVKANSVENGTAYRTYVGGVIGFIGEGSHTFKNISSNVKVIGSTCDIGGMFGIAHYGNNFENITFTGSVEAPADAEEVGGIAGVWHNQKGYTVTFTGVTSTGKVTIGTTTTTGSIVGGAYNADNKFESNSGELVINGERQWIVEPVAKISDKYFETLADAIAAAQTGDTITLLANIDLGTTCVTVKGKELTINLNGYNITGSGYRVLFVDLKADENKNGKLTLTGNGTVENTGTNTGNSYAVYVGGNSELVVEAGVTVKSAKGYAVVMLPMGAGRVSTLTVNGGTVTGRYAVSGQGALTDTSTEVTVNGGAIIGIDVAIYQPQPGTVTVNGGTVTCNGDAAIAMRRGTLTIKGGVINGVIDVYGDYSPVTATINGGDFTNATLKYAGGNTVTKAASVELAAPEGYKWNAEGVLVACVYVAQVGNVKYESVLEALKAAIDNGAPELKLLSDAREKMTSDFDIKISADLTITADAPVKVEFYNEGTSYDFAIGSTNNNTLTIGENVSFDLVDRVIWIGFWGNNVDVVVNGYLGGYQIWHGADTTVTENGTLDSHGEAFIMRRNATLTVDGGKVNANYFTIYSGHIVAENAEITAGLVWINNNHNYGSEGTVSVKLTNTSFTSNGEVKIYAGEGKNVSVTLTGGSTITANGAFKAGEDVVVVADSTSEFAAQNKSVFVAEVNGFKYSTLQAAIDAANGGTVELLADVELAETITVTGTVTLDLNGKTINVAYAKDSTTNHIYAFENKGTLTITGNGTINARGIFNYGTMTLENGTINAIDGNGGYAVRNYSGATFTMNGGTIATTLEDDHLVNNGGYDATTVRVDKGATFVMNGGTINNICDFTFAIDNSGTVTVNAGTVTSIHSTVSTYGTLTINGGSFTCNGLEGVTAHALVAWEGSQTTINGGTFDGKDNYNGFNVDACAGAYVEIKGGTFLAVHSGSLYGEGTIAVSGGTFFDAVPENRCAEGHIPAVVDGKYTVKLGAYVAQVGNVKYESLQAAIDNANGGVVTLLAPIVIESGKTVEIDLKGATVVYNSTTMGEAMITNYGTLVINDTEGDGVINYNYTGEADPSYGKGNYTIDNAGTLTVNGGKITIANLRSHAKYPINNNSTTGDAILVINGGWLYNYNTSAIRMFCNSTTYKNSVTINGGKVEGYCAVWVQNPGKNTVNSQLTITGGEIITTAAAYVNGTAALNEVGSAIYYTIAGNGGAWSEDSFVALTGGIFNENVYLAEDAPETITIGEGATFNGYLELPMVPVAQVGTVKFATLEEAIEYAYANGGVVTLLAPIVIEKGEELTIDLKGVTVAYSVATAEKSVAMITNKGTLTIEDNVGGGKLSFTYTGTSFGYGVGMYTISNEGGTVNIKGGTIENLTTVSGSMYDAIDNNSTLGDTVLNISGGKLYCSYIAIRQFANSTTHKNTVNVTGGEIEGGNCSIWVQNPGSKQPLANIEVSGGAFTGRILLGTSSGFAAAIKGGTFSTDVSDYVAEGYVCVNNGDGTYGVQKQQYFDPDYINLDLSADLSINFYYHASRFDGTDYFAVVQKHHEETCVCKNGGRDEDVISYIPFSEWLDKDGYKQVVANGIAAKEMICDVFVTIYKGTLDENGEPAEGSYALGEEYIDSIVRYVEYYIYLYGLEDAARREELTLFADMLVYGENAQKFFTHYKKDADGNPIYASNAYDCFAELIERFATKEAPELNDEIDFTGDPDYYFNTTNLTLENTIYYNLYFAHQNLVPGADIKVEYSFVHHNGTEHFYTTDRNDVSEKVTGYFDVKFKGSNLTISIDDLAPADLRLDVTAKVYLDGELVSTIKSSVEDHCAYAIWLNEEYGEEYISNVERALCESIMKYADSAYAFKH